MPLVGLCLLGFVALAGFALFFPSVYQYYLNSSSLAIGSSAPNFELTALSGETIRLDPFRGGPVLLGLGATWCPDCRAEAPVLEEFHRAHPELTILMIDSKESREVVQQFADDFGITHPILLDEDGAVMNLDQVFAIPTVLFIDAEG